MCGILLCVTTKTEDHNNAKQLVVKLSTIFVKQMNTLIAKHNLSAG